MNEKEARADASDTSQLSFLAGGGELGALIRGFDWAETPLGPACAWPQSLRTAVRIMLTSRQPIWIGWGPELTYLYNDPYKSIIGGKHPWALGRPTEAVWNEIWTDIGPMLATAMGGVEGTYVEEQLLIMERNGYAEETYYTFSYSPIPDDDGSPGGIICANTDDTQRVIGERRLGLLRELAASTLEARSRREAFDRSAQALAKASRDLPFLLLYASDGAGSHDLIAAAGFTSDYSPPATPLSTWPVAEVERDLACRLIDEPATHFEGRLAPGAWEKAPRQAALLAVPAQGEASVSGLLVVGLSPYRVFDDAYRGFLDGIAGQIAAAVASADAYESERRRGEALAELDRAKTAFFSNVSHEFRTPLTLMLGPLEDVLASDALPGTLRTPLETARRNGERLQRLVNSLLDVSRLEAGRVRATFEATDLAELTADIASSFRGAIERAGLRFHVRTSQLPQPVFIDHDMWEKILLNLLSNALKFTLAGEISVSVGVAVDGGSATVAVSDTGIGIAESELPRIFERFHRVEGAVGRSIEGSGIGLALSQELVKLHGGAIAVDSAPGVGTTFTISLPFGRAHLPVDRVREDPAPRSAPVRAQEFLDEALRWLPGTGSELRSFGPVPALGLGAQGGAGGDRRVLVADDNADMRDYISRLLETEGYAVTAAPDGEAALEAIRLTAPHLVMTDVMMPKLDGFGLLKAIRADPSTASVPVILVSARAGEEAAVEGLEHGADDYLVKPFAAREMLARVGANIQMAELRRDTARALFQSEQHLLTIEDRLSMALSTGKVSVYEWEIDTDRVTFLGPLAEAFGLSAEDAASAGLPSRAYLSAVHPDDHARVSDAVDVSAKTGAPCHVECRLRAAGREFYVIARGEVTRSADGLRRMSGAVVDISERRAAEQMAERELERRRRAEIELQSLNASLEERVTAEIAGRAKAEAALRQAQKMEAVGQLTGGVAHDFNNLLTVILGGLDTIRRSVPGDEIRVKRALEMASIGAQRAVGLTSRLLAFSRQQPLSPKPLELNPLVRDMTELLHGTLGEQIELEHVLAPRLWRTEVDQNQLESAILNLAVNARDAMPNGGKLTIETSNTALDESYSATDAEVVPGQYVAIAISDTGAGMSKETLSRVFEPFFTTKEVGRGTGLGLSMVYGFVKQSGGHITIYSEPGQGTTVKLYFPRYHGGGTARDPVSRESVPRASAGEAILVVEDNHEVRAYSVMTLRELGYRVLEAVDGPSALAILRSGESVDLLFTDVVLPGMNGRALADAARELRPGLKALFTTGYSRNAIVHQGRLDPGVHLLTKPFTFEQLATRVRDVIDQFPAAAP